jgi:hypothetical protein
LYAAISYKHEIHMGFQKFYRGNFSKTEITGTCQKLKNCGGFLYLLVDVSSASESVDRLALGLVDPLDRLVDVFDHSLPADDAS